MNCTTNQSPNVALSDVSSSTASIPNQLHAPQTPQTPAHDQLASLLASDPPSTAACPAPAILNAASIARMLPPPQIISSAANPFVTYPIAQYANATVGINGSGSHQMPSANPGWGYGLQGQQQMAMATPAYHMPAPQSLIPFHHQNNRRPEMHYQPQHQHQYQHQYHSHVQPHPNALLSSLAVAQAYQANMAAALASTHQTTPEMALPPVTQGIYRDLANDPCANDPDGAGDRSGTKDQSFTVKLHRMLSDDEFKDCICWMPHGRSWKVLKPDEFELNILHRFYRHGKLASFMRQVNGWGFRRMSAGPDKNSYYHEMFLRGFPYLSAKMRRPPHKTKSKSPEPKRHPNFRDSNSFVVLPTNDKIAIVSDSNHGTSSSDSNGCGGFDTDTTITGTNDGSDSDRGCLNMSNLLYGSSNGGSDRESNSMYGSAGSDQGSNLYASCSSDQCLNLYGSGGSDQGSSNGENTSNISDQDSNQDTSNDNISDGTGSENDCDDENSINHLGNMNVLGTKMTSRVSSFSETEENSNSPPSRSNHHRSNPPSPINNSQSQLDQARRPMMMAPTAKRPRLSPSNPGATQQQKVRSCSDISSSDSETSSNQSSIT